MTNNEKSSSTKCLEKTGCLQCCAPGLLLQPAYCLKEVASAWNVLGHSMEAVSPENFPESKRGTGAREGLPTAAAIITQATTGISDSMSSQKTQRRGDGGLFIERSRLARVDFIL
jgi:hypothetical protein